MSIHERFSTLLNRVAVAPNIARSRQEQVRLDELASTSREIDEGVLRAITKLETRVVSIEKELMV